MKVLIATSTNDFDPTEVAVPWKILRDAGHEVIFATDTGNPGSADERMLSGRGFGILKRLLAAQAPAVKTYHQMLQDNRFNKPISYSEIEVEQFSGLLLPGGHAKGVRPYLESPVLHKTIAGFFSEQKPVGAICHGVVAACRAEMPKPENLSFLDGKQQHSSSARNCSPIS